MRTFSFGVVCGFMYLFSGSAGAQEAPPPTPAAPQTPPDVVLLDDGGMVRGTISEKVANDYVVIVTASGEQRKFSMSEVKYAGPASEMPSSAPLPTQAEPKTPTKRSSGNVRPFATIHGEEARLRLESAEGGVTFHRRSGSATAGNIVATGFDDLCSAPCEVSVPAGNHVFALSQGADPPIAGEEPVSVPAGDSVVRGTYGSNSGIRTAGWIVGGAGLGLGLYLMVTASEMKEDCSDGICTDTYETNNTKLFGGAAIMTAGLVAGWVMISTKDSVSFTVSPNMSATLRRSPQLDARGLRDLAGLRAIGHF